MSYQVTFASQASKALKRLPQSVQKRIVKAAEKLANDPRPRGAKKMQGYDYQWRIRVGEYRVIYTVEDDKLLILILKLGNRKDVYRGS